MPSASLRWFLELWVLFCLTQLPLALSCLVTTWYLLNLVFWSALVYAPVVILQNYFVRTTLVHLNYNMFSS